MTELKTLKDIEATSLDLGCDEDGASLSTRLRQEAIKWYEYWMSEFSIQGGDEVCLGRATSFKDFFNLTEEDLK